jgi:kynureninase
MTNFYSEAAAYDAADPLATFRDRFCLPLGADGKPAIYLCGNSLGPMPKAAAEEVAAVMTQWSTLGVRGHHEGEHAWLVYHRRFTASLARLVGAHDSEVVAMNTLTVNLHLLLASFYRPTAIRHRILIEAGAFPSDRHAVTSQIDWHDRRPEDSLIEVVPSGPTEQWHTEDFVTAIEKAGDTLALVLLPGVQYRNGQALDIATITTAAHRVGALVGFDLAHAVGNVPLQLHEHGVDFAIWCHYKYVSAGPGAIGGAFVHDRHHVNVDLKRLTGWWGHDLATRFRMGPEFQAATGADGWQLSNPPILSLAPLAAALALFDKAGMTAMRAKSQALDAFARRLIAARCGSRIEILTPSASAARGCQLSLRVIGGREHGRRIFEHLTAHNVIGDWRDPDVIRLAPMPLYTQFAEVEVAVTRLAEALNAV